MIKQLYIMPSMMIDHQNNSSPPTPFATHGRNITVCPAVTPSPILSALLKCCLPTTLYQYSHNCSLRSQINKLLPDKCDLTKITTASYAMN
jgi:hypothetical protein